uniref:Uncharacterized protein n=1 Tax=Timema bartmani TaxID=61472 RepID=A0A7R9EYD5_9NEOP|nr:unnamed protein product [Timema bartmani]
MELQGQLAEESEKVPENLLIGDPIIIDNIYSGVYVSVQVPSEQPNVNRSQKWKNISLCWYANPAHKISKVKLHEVSNNRDEADGAESEMEDEHLIRLRQVLSATKTTRCGKCRTFSASSSAHQYHKRFVSSTPILQLWHVKDSFQGEIKEPATDNNLKNIKKSKLKTTGGTPIDKSFKQSALVVASDRRFHSIRRSLLCGEEVTQASQPSRASLGLPLAPAPLTPRFYLNRLQYCTYFLDEYVKKNADHLLLGDFTTIHQRQDLSLPTKNKGLIMQPLETSKERSLHRL